MENIIKKIYEGSEQQGVVSLDLVPLTDEQIEQLVKGYVSVDGDKIEENTIENVNGVLAKSNDEIIKLDSNFDITKIEGLFYVSHKNKILYADITEFSQQEKEYLQSIIQNRLKMKSKKRLTEEDITFPLLMSGKIKPDILKTKK